MIHAWIRDIRDKTKDMNRQKTIEYIADYYRVHITLLCLAIAVTAVVIYNFTAGRRTIDLDCAIVNTQTDDQRDEKMEKEIADVLGIKAENVRVDSAYQVATAKSETAGANAQAETGGTDYSGYDKFFFELGNRELDVVIMPKSLMTYCTELGGEFNMIGAGDRTWVYLSDTALCDEVSGDPDDPMVIAFPKNSRGEANASKFCQKYLGV